jgi:glycosyltransferase involved in cell wall biosynthesis
MDRKICFVTLCSLPLLTSSENIKYVGGSELKQVLIGRELAKRGNQVSFITYDENSENEKTEEITIIKSYPPSKNFSTLQNALLFWKSLKKANADIYFQSTGHPGIIPLFCIIHGKKYIKWLGSDSDLLFARFRNAHPILLKITVYFDIKIAHRIIVQNLFQKELMEKKFKKKCVLIKNPVIIPDDIKNFENRKNYILWVSTIRPVKQPEIFLKIAQSLPNLKFLMIGGESEKEKKLYNDIEREANTISNLEFLGFVPHHMIQKYYEEASLFINTSQIEGFPNTFLESWINSTPVISLNVDPDEIICNKKLGLHSKTFQQLILDIKTLMFDDKLRKEMSINGKKYVEQNHDLKKIADLFEELISSLKINYN